MTRFKELRDSVVKISPYVAILIISLLIIKWYFFNLGTVQLWNDEYSHVFAAKSLITSGKPLLLSGKPYTRALIYTYMVAASYKLFGVSELTSRLPSIIIGFLILIGFFIVSKKFSKSIVPPIIGLGFLAFDPAMYWWSRTCRMYILQSLIFFIGVLIYYFALEDIFNKKSRIGIIGKLAAFAALFALSYFIQPLTLLFLPVMVVYPLIHPKSKFDKKKLANFGIAITGLLVVYLIIRYTVPQFNIISMGKFIAGKFLPPNFKIDSASEEGYYLAFFLTNYMIVLPFFVYGVYLSFKEKNNFLILCSVTSVTIITILSIVFAILVDSRFLLFVLPFICIPAGVGAYRLLKMFVETFELKDTKLYVFIVVIFIIAIFAGRLNLQNLSAFRFTGPVDYRGTSNYLAKQPGYNNKQTVISTLPLATIYYLNDTDYWLRQVVDKRFIVNKDGKRLEYYSGVTILDDAKKLSKMLDKQKVWLIADAKRYKSYLKNDMKSVIINKMTPIAQFNGVRLFVNNRYSKKAR